MSDTAGLLYATAFSTVAVFSAFKWLTYSNELRAERLAASRKPTVSKEVVLQVIQETSKAADELIAVSEAALRAPNLSVAERMAMEEARPYALQADLTEAQRRVFAGRGLEESNVEFAFQYYNIGAGRDRKVIEAASVVRKQLGKHLLTKLKLRGILRDMFLHQCQHMDELADTIVTAIESGQEPMQVMQVAPMAAASEYIQGRIGLSLQDLMMRAQLLGQGDPEFQGQLEELMEKGQASVTRTMQENPKMAELFGGGM